jgi:hypothetical protein
MNDTATATPIEWETRVRREVTRGSSETMHRGLKVTVEQADGWASVQVVGYVAGLLVIHSATKLPTITLGSLKAEAIAAADALADAGWGPRP